MKTVRFWLQLLKNKLSTVVYLGPCYSPGLRLLLTATATVPATAAATAPPAKTGIPPPPLLRLLLPPPAKTATVAAPSTAVLSA